MQNWPDRAGDGFDLKLPRVLETSRPLLLNSAGASTTKTRSVPQDISNHKSLSRTTRCIFCAHKKFFMNSYV